MKHVLLVVLVLFMAGCELEVGPPIPAGYEGPIDQGANVLDTAMAAFGGLIASIPFGPLGMAIAATAITFWRKNKKLLVKEQAATREIVIGIEKGTAGDTDVKTELSKSMSMESKKLVADVKATI